MPLQSPNAKNVPDAPVCHSFRLPALVDAKAAGGILPLKSPPAYVGGEVQGLLRRHLTPRETDLARLVLAGHRNKEIAARIGITENTVKVYLCRVYAKLGVDCRFQFASLMRRHNAAVAELEGRLEERKRASPNEIATDQERTPFERLLSMARSIDLNADQAGQLLAVIMRHQ